MEDGAIIHLATMAAAKARAEPAALRAAARPWFMRVYRGVHFREEHNKHGSAIWCAEARRTLWLGSYETPEEAAYAWDAAARITRGNRAMPNFPEPSAVVTELSLAPPLPQPQWSLANWLLTLASATAAHHHQQQQQRTPAATALLLRQPSWVLPPFTQFYYLADRATANAAAAVDPPVTPMPELNAPMLFPPTNSASTEPVDTSLSLSCPAAAPTDPHRKRKLPMFLAGGSDQAVVGDRFTFTNGGASSTSAARPPVPPLRLQNLLEFNLFGRGGPGGAQ